MRVKETTIGFISETGDYLNINMKHLTLHFKHINGRCSSATFSGYTPHLDVAGDLAVRPSIPTILQSVRPGRVLRGNLGTINIIITHE